MTRSRLRPKDVLVYGALAAFTAWPALHIRLVERYDLSPWKLAGWGMYSAPRFGLLGMEVYGLDREAGAMEKLTSPSESLRGEAAAFLERYRWLRKLANPGDFAQAVLAEHPEWDELRILVFQPKLGRDTGMVALEQTSYEIGRSAR